MANSIDEVFENMRQGGVTINPLPKPLVVVDGVSVDVREIAAVWWSDASQPEERLTNGMSLKNKEHIRLTCHQAKTISKAFGDWLLRE